MFVDILEEDGKEEEESSSTDTKNMHRKGVLVARRQTQEIKLLNKNILSMIPEKDKLAQKTKKKNSKLKMD